MSPTRPRLLAVLVFGLAGAAIAGVARCAEVPSDCLLFVVSGGVIAALLGYLFGDWIAGAGSRWSAARRGAGAALLAGAAWVTVAVLASTIAPRGTRADEVPEVLIFALGLYVIVVGWAVGLAGAVVGYLLHASRW